MNMKDSSTVEGWSHVHQPAILAMREENGPAMLLKMEDHDLDLCGHLRKE